MKKLIKNNLKVFVSIIISGIVFTGIGVYAASTYFAHDISYTPKNENFKKENGETIDNVEDALNELYTYKANNLLWQLPAACFRAGNSSSEVTGWVSLPKVDNYNYLSIDSISLSSGEVQFIRLYNNNGESIKDFSLSNNIQTFDISSLKGYYALQVYVKNVNKWDTITLNNITLY